jgi:hypothetical protein
MEVLTKALHEPSPMHRVWALEALGEIGEPFFLTKRKLFEVMLWRPLAKYGIKQLSSF